MYLTRVDGLGADDDAASNRFSVNQHGVRKYRTVPNYLIPEQTSIACGTWSTKSKITYRQNYLRV